MKVTIEQLEMACEMIRKGRRGVDVCYETGLSNVSVSAVTKVLHAIDGGTVAQLPKLKISNEAVKIILEHEGVIQPEPEPAPKPAQTAAIPNDVAAAIQRGIASAMAAEMEKFTTVFNATLDMVIEELAKARAESNANSDNIYKLIDSIRMQMKKGR